MTDHLPASAQAEINYRQRKLQQQFKAANGHRDRFVEQAPVRRTAGQIRRWSPRWTVRRLLHS
jgi:hypothetical protein